MNPTEIKKVLTAYENHKFDMLKSKYPSGAITQAEMMDSFIASLDPLQHLFGSPLSQIEDMVEGLKPKPKLIESAEQIKSRYACISKTVCEGYQHEHIIQAMEEYASQFKPLAAMPSDAIDFANWTLEQRADTDLGGDMWEVTLKDGKTYFLTTAELYTAYLKRKGETK